MPQITIAMPASHGYPAGLTIGRVVYDSKDGIEIAWAWAPYRAAYPQAPFEAFGSWGIAEFTVPYDDFEAEIEEEIFGERRLGENRDYYEGIRDAVIAWLVDFNLLFKYFDEDYAIRVIEGPDDFYLAEVARVRRAEGLPE